MKTKHRAIERRVTDLGKVVDCCIAKHGRHLPASVQGKIRGAVLEDAERLLSQMTLNEIVSESPEMEFFRDSVCDVEDRTTTAIVEVSEPRSCFVIRAVEDERQAEGAIVFSRSSEIGMLTAQLLKRLTEACWTEV